MELKNLTLEDLKRVSMELKREINEREQMIFEEDCKDLAKQLREFLDKNYGVYCYIEEQCDNCEHTMEFNLWDYMENVIEDLERNCK